MDNRKKKNCDLNRIFLFLLLILFFSIVSYVRYEFIVRFLEYQEVPTKIARGLAKYKVIFG